MFPSAIVSILGLSLAPVALAAVHDIVVGGSQGILLFHPEAIVRITFLYCFLHRSYRLFCPVCYPGRPSRFPLPAKEPQRHAVIVRGPMRTKGGRLRLWLVRRTQSFFVHFPLTCRAV